MKKITSFPAIFLLFLSCTGQDKWETSWEKFAKEIAPYPAKSENPFLPEVKAKFDGKQIVWEGTVSKTAKYLEEKSFIMEVTPQPFKIVSAQAVGGEGSGNVNGIQVKPKKGSLEAWGKVAPGTKVRFKAVLEMPIYMIASFNGGVHLLFFVTNAEPVLNGQ